jgi:hypothetical protein
MSKRVLIVRAGLLSALVLFAIGADSTTGAKPDGRRGVIEAGLSPEAAGGGTAGKLPVWTSSNTLGDSVIGQSKSGNVGVGATNPQSRLTVAGLVETTGGIKFPDGTIQTSAVVANSNAPLLIQDIDNPARQPFSTTVAIGQLPFNVPAGRRLVIEYVSSAFAVCHGCHVFDVAITATSASNPTAHHVLATFVGTGADLLDHFIIAQALRVYADPGSAVSVSLNTEQAQGGNVTVSGYLVNLP